MELQNFTAEPKHEAIVFGRRLSRRVDIGPDQHQRPKNAAKDQRGPTTDGYRLSPRMTASTGNMSWHHPERDENRDQGRDDDDQDDPSEDIDKGHGGDPL